MLIALTECHSYPSTFPPGLSWCALLPPARSVTASLTVAAAAALTAPPPSVEARNARASQLRAACRLLRFHSARADHSDRLAHWRRAACATLAVTLAAHGHPATPRLTSLARAFATLASDNNTSVAHSSLPSDAGAEVAAAASQSGHATLALVATPLLAPCAATLAAVTNRNSALNPSDIVPLARAWALLGAARCHLLAPPPHLDPAATPAHACATAQRALLLSVLPEMAARCLASSVQGAEVHGARLAGLADEAALLRGEAEGARGRCVARPRQSQYPELAAETGRFLAGPGAAARVAALADAAVGGGGGAARAVGWADGARALAEGLARRFPAYVDLTLPLRQALLEAAAGFAVLAACVEHPQARGGGC